MQKLIKTPFILNFKWKNFKTLHCIFFLYVMQDDESTWPQNCSLKVNCLGHEQEGMSYIAIETLYL